MVARLPLRHSWTHPEGWRDWPYETPATTATSPREGANSREMCGGLRALRHTVTTAKTRAKGALNGCESSGVQGVQGAVPAGGPVRVRAVLRAAGGRLRPQQLSARCRRAAPTDPGRSAEHLALRRLSAAGGRP